MTVQIHPSFHFDRAGGRHRRLTLGQVGGVSRTQGVLLRASPTRVARSAGDERKPQLREKRKEES